MAKLTGVLNRDYKDFLPQGEVMKHHQGTGDTDEENRKERNWWLGSVVVQHEHSKEPGGRTGPEHWVAGGGGRMTSKGRVGGA